MLLLPTTSTFSIWRMWGAAKASMSQHARKYLFVVSVSGALDREEETDNAVADINQSFHKRMRARANFFASANKNGVDLKMAAEEID